MGEKLSWPKGSHILFVSRSLPFHHLGGMEIIAWDLARQFVRDGYRVSFLTTEIPHKTDVFEIDGVNVIALKGTKPGVYSRAWWRESRNYFASHLVENVDIILSVSTAANSLLKIANVLSIPVILQAHGTSIGEIKSKWRALSPKSILSSFKNIVGLFKDLLNYPKYNYVVAVGNAVYNDLRAFPVSLVLPVDKLKIIYNGIDTSLFFPDDMLRKQVREKFGIQPQTRVILSASRLHRQKGLHYGLAAFAKYTIKNPDACYVILGEGPARKELEEQARQLGIEQKVRFSGAISREEVNQYMAASDLFLFTTTRAEGLPLNILEALAAGLPVIMSEHLELGQDNIPGVNFVNPQNCDQIDALMQKIFIGANSTRSSLLPDKFTLAVCSSEYRLRG